MVRIPEGASPELRAVLLRNASQIEAGQKAAEAELVQIIPATVQKTARDPEVRFRGKYRDWKMAAAGDDS